MFFLPSVGSVKGRGCAGEHFWGDLAEILDELKEKKGVVGAGAGGAGRVIYRTVLVRLLVRLLVHIFIGCRDG